MYLHADAVVRGTAVGRIAARTACTAQGEDTQVGRTTAAAGAGANARLNNRL